VHLITLFMAQMGREGGLANSHLVRCLVEKLKEKNAGCGVAGWWDVPTPEAAVAMLRSLSEVVADFHQDATRKKRAGQPARVDKYMGQLGRCMHRSPAVARSRMHEDEFLLVLSTSECTYFNKEIKVFAYCPLARYTCLSVEP
jgi:hypothetical protein